MGGLGHLGSLNSKSKSNWNYIKLETTWKWKRDLKNYFKLNLDVLFFMAYLGHVGVLKLKQKSNWKYIKTNQNMIWKY